MQKKIHQDIIIGIILILISTFLYIKTFDLTRDAALFPRGLIVLFSLFAVIIIIKGISKTRLMRQGNEIKYEGDESAINFRLLASPIITLIFVVVYILLLYLIGFFPSTILFIAGYLWYKKVKDWKAYLFVLVGINLFIYLIFVMQLNVQLPLGIFFE